MTAEQPHEGYVYFITSGEATKVGWSLDPERRLRSLQTGNPEPLVLLAKIEGTKKDERRIHKSLRRARLHGLEWFQAGAVLAYLAGRDVPTIFDRSDSDQTPDLQETA